MTFTPVKKVNMTTQIVHSIQTAILDGVYRPGDRLPAERELAEQFHANRSTVREALQHLEARGMVRIRQGDGVRVLDFLTTAGLQLLPHLLAPRGTIDWNFLADLLSMRVMLLGWTARRAALDRGDRDLAPLTSLVERLESAPPEPATLQTLDYEFFEELVRLTGNRVLALLTNAIREVYAAHRELFSQIYVPGLFDPAHHRTTRDAIAAGDADRAEAAMKAYAQTAADLLGALLNGKDKP